MDEAEIDNWFSTYLADFGAVGRGDVENIRCLLEYYGVPLLISTEAGFAALSDESQVLAFAERQVEGLRSAGYDRSDELAADTTVLNGSCALRRGRFSRLRKDGSEIAQIACTYLITGGPAGRRISAIVVHTGQPRHGGRAMSILRSHFGSAP